MLIISESQDVFNAHDIRACYYTVNDEKRVSVHIGYPSDQPVKPNSDHKCTVHNVIYSAHNMELCLALIKCITASLTSNCKVFYVNANVERVAQLEKWVQAVIGFIQQQNAMFETPTGVQVAQHLEKVMKADHINAPDASGFVSMMIDAGILFIKNNEISIANIQTSIFDTVLGINKHSPILNVETSSYF